MSVDITGRHIEITEPLRKFATDRLERLRGVIDEVLEVHFILTVEKHQRHIAEINIRTRHDFYHAGEVFSTTSVIEVEEALGEGLPRIIRTHEVAAKPMSVDDAAIQIGASDRDFLVFRNADTERLNVVYKRKDGNIGWIEPEA